MSVFTNLFLSCEKAQDEHLIGYRYSTCTVGSDPEPPSLYRSDPDMYTRERVAKYNVYASGAVITLRDLKIAPTDAPRISVVGDAATAALHTPPRPRATAPAL